MATQVASRIRDRASNVELPLSGYLQLIRPSPELAPVVSGLLQVDGDPEQQVEVIMPLADRDQPLPASFAQQRSLVPGPAGTGRDTAYNQLLALRLRGQLSTWTRSTQSLQTT